MTRSVLIAMALATATAASLTAQRPGPRGDGPGREILTWLLSSPAELNLTAAQQRQLRERADALDRADATLRLQIDSLWQGRDPRTLAWADRHALMSATRTMREARHSAFEGAVSDMRALLTPAQQGIMDRHAPVTSGRGMGPMGRGGDRMGRGCAGMRGGMMGHRHCPGC